MGEEPGAAIVVVASVVAELTPLGDIFSPAAWAVVDGVSFHVSVNVGLDADGVSLEFWHLRNAGLSSLDVITW